MHITVENCPHPSIISSHCGQLLRCRARLSCIVTCIRYGVLCHAMPFHATPHHIVGVVSSLRACHMGLQCVVDRCVLMLLLSLVQRHQLAGREEGGAQEGGEEGRGQGGEEGGGQGGEEG